MKIRTALLLVVVALVLVGAVWKFVGSGSGPNLTVEAAPQPGHRSDLDDRGIAALGVQSSVRTDLAVVEDLDGVATEAEDGPSLGEAGSGTLRIEVTWRDGLPASGVAILIASPTVQARDRGHHWDVTDSAGVVEHQNLDPGRYLVESDRGGNVEAEIRAGETVTAKLALKGNCDVHGIVRDAGGLPVAGADIVASNWRWDWRGSRVVATSGDDGRFVVRCVDAGGGPGTLNVRALGAVAAGWVPSKLFSLSRIDPESVGEDHVAEVVLHLTERGADVWGIVTTPDGAPVEGTLVALGSTSFMMTSSYPSPSEGFKPLVTLTGADGHYRLDGVPVGIQKLAARSRDWPVWSTEIELVAGEQSRHDIALIPGVTVFGTAKLASGELAPQAIVLALPEPFDSVFADQGPIEGGSPFTCSCAKTDRDGRFRLGPLAPGTLHLYASLGTSFEAGWDSRGNVYQGMQQETLDATPGELLEWNPTLTLGLEVSGRAVYADGSPLRDMFVTATDAEGEDLVVSTTSDGTFVISNLKNTLYRITLQMPHLAPKAESVAAIYDVLPPAANLVFQLHYTPGPKAPKGKLRLRMKDTAGLGVKLGKGAVTPVVHFEGSWSSKAMTAVDEDVFETGLRPGFYQVALEAQRFRVLQANRIEIRSGETLDLGLLETVPLGTLAVTVVRPEGFSGAVEVGGSYLYAPRHTIPPEEDTAVFSQLAVGEMTIQVSGAGLVKEAIATEVSAGTQTQLTVSLRPAAQVRIESTLRQPRGFRRFVVRVTDATGKTWYERAKREGGVGEWPQVNEVALPLGSYTVRLETADGQSAERMLVVTTTGSSAAFPIQAR